MPQTDEALRRVPLLAGLDDRQLKQLANGMKERTVQAGDDVVTQGQGGIAFFVILDGQATVYVDGQERRTLGPGDYLGEAALIVPDVPRTATVTAASDMRLGTITAWAFKPLVEDNPQVAWRMLETLARRLADTPGA